MKKISNIDKASSLIDNHIQELKERRKLCADLSVEYNDKVSEIDSEITALENAKAILLSNLKNGQ